MTDSLDSHYYIFYLSKFKYCILRPNQNNKKIKWKYLRRKIWFHRINILQITSNTTLFESSEWCRYKNRLKAVDKYWSRLKRIWELESQFNIICENTSPQAVFSIIWTLNHFIHFLIFRNAKNRSQKLNNTSIIYPYQNEGILV